MKSSMQSIKTILQAEKNQKLNEGAKDIKSHRPDRLQHVLELASEKAFQVELLHHPLHHMDLLLTRVLSWMLSAFIVAGHLPICQPNVFVVQILGDSSTHMSYWRLQNYHQEQ